MRYQKPARVAKSTDCRLYNKMYELIRKYPAATRLLSSVADEVAVRRYSRTSTSSSCTISRRRSYPTETPRPVPSVVYSKPVACTNVQVYSKVYTIGRPLPASRVTRTACQLYPKIHVNGTKPRVARLPSSVSEPMRDLKTALLGIRICGSNCLNTKEYTRPYPTTRLPPSVLVAAGRPKPLAYRTPRVSTYPEMYTRSYTSPRQPYTDVYKTGDSYVQARRLISTMSAGSTRESDLHTRVSSSVAKTLRSVNAVIREVQSATVTYRPGTTYPTATRLPSSVPPTIRKPKPAAPRAIRTSTSASGSVTPPASTYRPEPVASLNSEFKRLRARTRRLLYELDVSSREPSWCTKYGS